MNFFKEYKLPLIVGLLCVMIAALFLNLTKTDPHGGDKLRKANLPPVEYKVLKMN